MRLRGHHLFCASLFQGKGYNGAFAARMEEVLAALSRGEAFLLCEGCDSLCAACPNCRPGNQCARERKMRPGGMPPPSRLWSLFRGRGLCRNKQGRGFAVSQRRQWKSVCEGCRWQREGLCSWGLFQKMRKQRFV